MYIYIIYVYIYIYIYIYIYMFDILISFPRSCSRYLAKTHVRTSPTLVLVLRCDKTSILFPVFVVTFSFYSGFF